MPVAAAEDLVLSGFIEPSKFFHTSALAASEKVLPRASNAGFLGPEAGLFLGGLPNPEESGKTERDLLGPYTSLLAAYLLTSATKLAGGFIPSILLVKSSFAASL